MHMFSSARHAFVKIGYFAGLFQLLLVPAFVPVSAQSSGDDSNQATSLLTREVNVLGQDITVLTLLILSAIALLVIAFIALAIKKQASKGHIKTTIGTKSGINVNTP